MNINKIITHKYFHCAAVVLMIFNIIGYISIQSMECVLIFGASAYAANHFTKNRGLDILIGLFVANVLFGCGRVKENFTSGSVVENLTKVVEGLDCTMTDDKTCPEGCKEYKNKEGKRRCKAAANNALSEAMNVGL